MSTTKAFEEGLRDQLKHCWYCLLGQSTETMTYIVTVVQITLKVLLGRGPANQGKPTIPRDRSLLGEYRGPQGSAYSKQFLPQGVQFCLDLFLVI